MIHGGVGEVVTGAADHDDVGGLVGPDQGNPLKIRARVAVRQEVDAGAGEVGSQIFSGRGDGRDDVGGLDREPRVAERPGASAPPRVVVFVISLNGRSRARIHQSVSTAPAHRLPRDGKHPVDVEQVVRRRP